MNAILLAALLLGATPAAQIPVASPWTEPAQRVALTNTDIRFRDHDGRAGTLKSLLDRPSVVTFFYTRCQNTKKCSMAVSRLATLQRELTEAGIAGRVRIIAVSYEPQFDTPERIHRFATDRGLELGPGAVALQLDAERHQRLVEELNVPASYNAGWINTHGVELSVLDAEGRVVRKYHTVMWDDGAVVEDLKQILGGK